uniref:Growth arrest specific 7 n=1 Tax=Oryctolagus cuniculus TaxID=9986 RepID=A0A5F9C184_RABIT
MVPPPPGEESQTVVLPPGWQSYLSPQGRRYYVNTATNETTWERPSSVPGIPASPGPHRSSLPPTVNGYHASGTPAHPPETAHMSLRKSAGDSQNLGSSSPSKKQSKENTITELERLEVERVEMIRQHLCQYTQLRHETDMFNQSTVEPVDQLLRKVDPARDRELWVREHKTGNIRPVDMEI